MRLSTLGRAAGGTAAVLFVAAAVADVFGHHLLRLFLLITSGALATPVAGYLLLLLPARPTPPSRSALPPAATRRPLPAPSRHALPAAPIGPQAQPAALPAAPATRALPARRPSPRANQRVLTH